MATATVTQSAGRNYVAYVYPSLDDERYIERAKERAEKEALTVIPARDKSGRKIALVNSVSEPNKWHAVVARRLAGVRIYICDCKGMDPYGDKTYHGYCTCKHAEKVRLVYGD